MKEQAPIHKISPWRFWLKRLRMATMRVVFVLVAVILAVITTLQFPFVQTYLGKKATATLSEALQHDVQIKKIAFNWFDEIALKEVRILDKSNRTMIAVDLLEVDFRYSVLIEPERILLDAAILEGVEVNFITDKDEEILNLDKFLNAIDALSPPDTTSTSSGPAIVIHKIKLRDAAYSMHNYNYPLNPKAGYFDEQHIQMGEIRGDVTDLRIVADTIELDISHLSTKEMYSGLPVYDLSTFFRYCRKGMDFYGLNAQIGQSVVKDTLRFMYDSPLALSNFNQEVGLYINFDQTHLHTDEIAYFAPSLKDWHEQYILSGKLRGKVSDFRLSNLDATVGTNSKLKGSIAMKGLPNIDKTYMDISLFNSRFSAKDLDVYVPDAAMEYIHKARTLKTDKASFKGFIDKFKVVGTFHTGLGSFFADLNMEPEKEKYNGYIKTKDFHLGMATGYPEMLQKINFDGNIKGSGFSLNSADMVLTAKIDRIGVQGYEYQQIEVDSTHLRRKLFDGKIRINDPNIKFTLLGQVNFQDSTFRFNCQIDSAKLNKLNFVDDTIMVSSRIVADFKGLTPERIRGRINLGHNAIHYNGNDLQVDTLSLSTFKNNRTEQRTIMLRSGLGNMVARGDFEIIPVINDAKNLLKEWVLDWRSEDSTLVKYYDEKTKELLASNGKEIADSLLFDEYQVDLSFELLQPNKVVNFLDLPLYISEGTTLKTHLESGKNSKITLSVLADTLGFRDYYLMDDQLNFYGAKEQLNPYFDAEIYFSSKKQLVGDLELSDFEVDGYRLDENYILTSKIFHESSGDYVNFNGYLNVLDSGYQVNFPNTTFKFLDKVWNNSGGGKNTITIAKNSIHFDEVKFTAEQQSVYLRGVVAEGDHNMLYADITNFDLAILSTYLDEQIKGNLNLTAIGKDITNNSRLNSFMKVTNFHMGKHRVGEVDARIEWEDKTKEMILESSLERDEETLMQLNGVYHPNAPKQEQISMGLVLNNFSAEVLEPFVKTVLSDISGTVSGLLQIKGNPSTVRLDGDAEVYEGQFRINYLNTLYSFSDKIHFTNESIEFNDFKLIDENNNFAFVNGGVFIDKQDRYKIDIKAEASNFQLLKTSAKDNSTYYGTAYGSGDILVNGTPSDLNITVNAKSEKNTKIYLPLDASGGIEEQSFIKFVDRSDTTSVAKVEVKKEAETESTGLNLELNLEITPDAYCEIIFDKRTGDIIRGSGQGKVQMLINPAGDFTMYGDVEIVKGAYNFTMANLIDKRFDIVPNQSHITWTGDPYQAQLDVTAAYTQTASLGPIITGADSVILNQPEIKRRYPVKVLLNMKGELLSPQFAFDIAVEDFPRNIMVIDQQSGAQYPLSLESYVNAFEARIKTDEQELNRQVFSLMVLRKLSEEDQFTGIANSAGSSVSELLTNQLSYWLSQVDDKLEIDVSLDGLSSDALNAMQVRLSYSFMQGRLRITREGNFTNVDNEADLNSVVGNWTLEYLLSEEGNVRLKFYRKNNNSLLNAETGSTTTSGVSILHTRSFNNFKDLFGGKKEKAPKRKEKPVPPEPSANDAAETESRAQLPRKRKKENDR